VTKKPPSQRRTTAAPAELIPGFRPAVGSRVQRSRELVLAAAYQSLCENGVGGFSVDEVARRSGVAKTTIYRHWPSREALVVDTCSQMTSEEAPPDSGSLEGDVTSILRNLGHILGTAKWSTVVPSIVDAAERDADFANVHANIQRGHAAPLRRVLDQAKANGGLRATADPSSIVSALIGPLYYRRWFSREPIDNQFIDMIVNNVIGRQRVPPRE
jgi:AcrR family transcriptional regulator